MRITAGKYKNRKLFSPADSNVRPTMERAKEALFSILKARLENFEELSFLDVFAGSGSMGFEALSRGFEEVCFIDIDTTTLLKNAKLFNEPAPIKKLDATNLPLAPKAFDVVFLDAPYNKGLSEKAYKSLKENGWINDESFVIIELEKKEDISLDFIEEKRYGLNKFLFL
ncbi:MAG: 16S rRNA (guanine(966)-N(2))-methyltransferase RsmD [Alphaproteobacteria bacterium]